MAALAYVLLPVSGLIALVALTWVVAMVVAAAGRDLRLPGLGVLLERAAALPPGGSDAMRGEARR